MVGVFWWRCKKECSSNNYIPTSNFVHLAEVELAHLMLGEIVGAERAIHLVLDSLVELTLQFCSQQQQDQQNEF